MIVGYIVSVIEGLWRFLLADPRFVGVHLIPESDNPEDDKIFLFFKENAMDGEHTGKATISRIGQLCKVTTRRQTPGSEQEMRSDFLKLTSCVFVQNDLGGHRSLVNKWTTFLKARLLCSVPGVNGIDTHFDELRERPVPTQRANAPQMAPLIHPHFSPQRTFS